MGFYLRKSISVGPFRFNLSKSGVGVSAGVRGLRIGTSPRGNYVHVGRHGVYYRAALGGRGAGRVAPLTPSSGPRPEVDGAMQEIESADVTQMTDSSSAELLAEFDRKRKKIRLAPVVVVFGAIGVVMGSGAAPGWLIAVALVLVVLLWWLARSRDMLEKTVVLLYHLGPDAERQYQQLHDAFDELRGCGQTWHVEAQGNVHDRKRNAGASSQVRRKAVRLSKRAPPYVKTNIEVPAIPVGRQTLYLFPDRLLVFEPKAVGAVPYARLNVARSSTRFIEHGTVPNDARVVGHTWQYVNKGGGPDKRFKNNRQIPIALYEEIVLRSDSGLNELLQASKLEAGQKFEQSIQAIASAKLSENATDTATDGLTDPPPIRVDGPSSRDGAIEFPGTGDFRVKVVGESYCQQTLKTLGGTRREQGEEVIFTAALVPEPTDPHDSNTIKVCIHNGGHVGYLSRGDAAEYQVAARALIERHAVGLCRAKLIGGTPDEPTLDVQLDLAEPPAVVQALSDSEGDQRV